MINEEDRTALVNYRIEQAISTIELTQFLIEADKLTVAVNRIYYGIFYSVTAIASKHQFETSKHSQLIGWFNKEFIATGLIEKKYGKILRNAYQNRTKGDYDAFVSFQKEEVLTMLDEMIDFINMIKTLL
jgi:uncharacterized protein (UPF0332 family)